MVTQSFEVIDVQRTKSGETRVGSLILQPIIASSETPAPMPPMPYGVGTLAPSQLRMTGIPVEQVADLDIGDTVTLTLTKVVA